MRIFNHRLFPEIEVDLDDPETYEYLPNDLKDLRKLMLSEIGYAFCYMNFWHKNTYKKGGMGDSQRERIDELITFFTANEKTNYSNVRWHQEQIFIFQNEIENMC